MLVKEIFELGLKKGIAADPRGANGIKEYLADVKKDYENSKPDDKKYFNQDLLINPYADSAIHVDDGKTQVKRVLSGIDVGSGEIILASQLSERNKNIDLVIAHHPVGFGLANLAGVMDMQVEVFVKAGVPVHVAEKIMEERIHEVSRGVHPSNHYQLVDVARLLKVNLINTHTITDNLVTEFLENYINKRNPKLVGDLLDCLTEIPEYHEGKMRGAGPSLFAGNPKHRVGKWLVEMTGGTNPSDKIYNELSHYGVSTVVGMHMRETAKDKANESHMNVVIAGHISSDSLGMNLFLDELEKKGIEIVPCGGLIRVSRVSKK